MSLVSFALCLESLLVCRQRLWACISTFLSTVKLWVIQKARGLDVAEIVGLSRRICTYTALKCFSSQVTLSCIKLRGGVQVFILGRTGGAHDHRAAAGHLTAIELVARARDDDAAVGAQTHNPLP